MKRFFTFTIGFIIILMFSQCGPTTDDAANYNDKLISDQIGVINAINEVDNAFSTFKPSKIEPAIKAAKIKIDKSIKALDELGGFDKNTEFKDATMELYKLFKSQLENEYAEQLKIYKLPEEEYTKEQESRYNGLQKLIDEKYTLQFNKFSEAQKNFAAKWGFELEYSAN